MDDFASWTELLLCAGIMLTVVFCWGKLKTMMAMREMKKAETLLHGGHAEQAIKCLEQLSKDLDSPRYWYLLGLAFARLGSVERASQAFNRVLEKDGAYLNTQQVLATLSMCAETAPAEPAAGTGGKA